MDSTELNDDSNSNLNEKSALNTSDVSVEVDDCNENALRKKCREILCDNDKMDEKETKWMKK